MPIFAVGGLLALGVVVGFVLGWMAKGKANHPEPEEPEKPEKFWNGDD